MTTTAKPKSKKTTVVKPKVSRETVVTPKFRKNKPKVTVKAERPKVKTGGGTELFALRCKLFVEYLLANGGNKTQAAISCGYNPQSAARSANRLSNDPWVKAQIKLRHEEIFQKLKVTNDRLVLERARLAFSNVGEMLNPDGSVKKLTEVSEDLMRAITGIEVTEQFQGEGKEKKLVARTHKIKVAVKDAHLLALERQRGMYNGKEDPDNPTPVAPANTDKIAVARAIAFVLADASREVDKRKGAPK